MTSPPVLLRFVSSAVVAAGRAGKIIRDVMKKGELNVVEKTNMSDLQTEADLKAQKYIISYLQKQYPTATIIGEEDEYVDRGMENVDVRKEDELDEVEDVLKVKCTDEVMSVKEKDIVVWVDPLDGTSEYTVGLLDHVTVLIGFAVEGRPIAGVIHQPYYNYESGPSADLGRTVWGLTGSGAWGLSRTEPPAEQRIITTTRAHNNQVVSDCIAALRPTEIIRVGGAGHKALLLIEGKAHAYVFASAGTKKWDTCAPEAVLEAIGGKLTDIHGNKIVYDKNVKHGNTGGVLAAFSDHQWYVDHVPESVKTALTP